MNSRITITICCMVLALFIVAIVVFYMYSPCSFHGLNFSCARDVVLYPEIEK